MPGSGYRQIEHTADLAFELWAPDARALFLEAMHAVIAVLTEDAVPEPNAERTIAFDCLDEGDGLVQWVNEIVYLAAGEGFLAAAAELALTPGHVHAHVHGQADAREAIKTEIKSATYHDLAFTHHEDGVRARLVLDV